MLAGLAALPIALILGLMLAVRWSARDAGLVGLATALLLAWFVFGFGRTIYGDIGIPAATAGALAEATFIAATILWIIFPALCIHQLQLRTGGVDAIRSALGRLSPDPRIAALVVAWFFALFIEGAAGFGTTIALAAPLLVSLGLTPIAAVTAALIGHAVGVSFGAVGTPVVPQIAATGLAGLEIAQTTSLFHLVLGWVMVLLTLQVIRRALPQAPTGRRIWAWAGVAAVLFLLPMFLIAQFIGPELPTLGGALLGALGFVAALRLTGASAQGTTPPGEGGKLLRAASPYLALVALILLTRLLDPVRETVRSMVVGWELFDRFAGSFEPFYHPGTLLAISFVIGAVIQRARLSDLRGAITAAALQVFGVTIALLAMLGLSRILVHAGMIDTMAAAAAAATGDLWPLFAPLVGVLGTFVTGSATASNILFTDFQQATALSSDLPVIVIVAAQGFGAAVGNIICPHNIIAGGATVGLQGAEGEVLRRTLPACGIYVALGGLMALLLTLGVFAAG
ncbi:MAG: L-lactate permease [Oscillochloris sp.]|nr:L-lactate permease [Oscillochloris sp.]